MSSIRKLLFIVLMNLAVLLTLLGLIAVAPPIASDLYRLMKPVFGDRHPSDSRSELPNYQHQDWAKKHFEEIGNLPTEYFDFVVWRRKPFAGATITIDSEGYRRHFNRDRGDWQSATIWFFGGSTAWGLGSRDDESIPASIQKYSSKSTFNFGEVGYVAHQSLNLLMKAYLEGGRPEIVFFYDGVNEVAHKCRTGYTVFSSAQELVVREKIEPKTPFGRSRLASVFDPTLHILRSAREKFRRAPPVIEYDCHTNAPKAALIAQHLVSNWKVAKFIVESHGGVFVPVLQPVAYIGSPNVTHLPQVSENEVLRKQYETVYEQIRLAAEQSQIAYVDITDVFDVQDLVYIDFCHVSPNGSALVAERLLKATAYP